MVLKDIDGISDFIYLIVSGLVGKIIVVFGMLSDGSNYNIW